MRECVNLSVCVSVIVFACARTRPKGVFTQPVCFLMFPNTVDFVIAAVIITCLVSSGRPAVEHVSVPVT